MSNPANNETVRIVIEHDDGEGNRLSTFHLTYPTMDNASANILQLDLGVELFALLRQYSKAKAKARGLEWPAD